ncbi:MAG TPA: M28 family peptidase [Verrucomicrobiae bacterium]|nr:M28 family peptidase [Verrucomicrobiae bacterium]
MKKLLFGLAIAGLILAQGTVDTATVGKIRSEALEHSDIMHIEHMLTDRYGPRVTGTPNHEAAVDWLIRTFNSWGLKNAHKEGWDFGHPGWLNERASAFLVAPVHENLKFEVLAWTPSTRGTITASVVQLGDLPHGAGIPPPDNANAGGGRGGRGGLGRGPQYKGPTREQLTAWLEVNKAKIKGKMVMFNKAAVIPVSFDPIATRGNDEQLKAQYDPNSPGRGRGGFFGRGAPRTPDPGELGNNDIRDVVDAWLIANGAVARFNDAARANGIIVAQQHNAYDPSKTIPTIILRNDDYGRIERLLADGDDVKVELNIVNHLYPEGKTSYNVVAEIPGADKADEVVMLGGHLDSWHAATGATDNGIGSSIMIEAIRVLQALKLRPHRTVRVALWSGEEEGLLGSLAYVKAHFGSAEEPKPEWYKLDCYFNVDTGTGALRGAGIFGPPQAAAALRPVLHMFEDLGMYGATANNSRNVGGTDSTSFANAGLPGIGMQQDPIEYNTVTHHTNLDTYERIIPDDVKKAAAIIASAVWDVANQPEMIPRFTRDQMPPKPADRGN